jgi:hypothetical protein
MKVYYRIDRYVIAGGAKQGNWQWAIGNSVLQMKVYYRIDRYVIAGGAKQGNWQ